MKVIAVLLLALASASAGTLANLKPVHPRDRTMGQRTIEGRIVGGKTAFPGQFPYQVGISFTLGDQPGGWSCGGSIVGNYWILTAAHCTDGAKGAIIDAGCILLQAGVKLKVTSDNFRQHPDYNPWLLTNDISMIKLEKPLKFGLWINKIELPSLTGPHDSYVDQKATVSGYGLTSDNSTSLSFLLQYAEVEVIPNKDCNEAYLGFIKDSHVCTSVSDGQSTCSGDSGGALALYIGKKYLQIAITSFGSIFGCTDKPSGYTRVTSFLKWIDTTSGISYM